MSIIEEFFIKNKPPATNELWKLSDKFFVSYNECPCRGYDFLTSDTGGAETALVIDGKFYILNGDYRERYIKAFQSGGKEAIVKLYAEESEKNGSTWTTGTDILNWLEARAKAVGEDT